MHALFIPTSNGMCHILKYSHNLKNCEVHILTQNFIYTIVLISQFCGMFKMVCIYFELMYHFCIILFYLLVVFENICNIKNTFIYTVFLKNYIVKWKKYNIYLCYIKKIIHDRPIVPDWC